MLDGFESCLNQISLKVSVVYLTALYLCTFLSGDGVNRHNLPFASLVAYEPKVEIMLTISLKLF